MTAMSVRERCLQSIRLGLLLMPKKITEECAKKEIRSYYPYGARTGHRYKVWLHCIKEVFSVHKFWIDVPEFTTSPTREQLLSWKAEMDASSHAYLIFADWLEQQGEHEKDCQQWRDLGNFKARRALGQILEELKETP